LDVVLPFASNADPAAVFPLQLCHPLREFPLSRAVALKQCSVFSLEPQTRVFRLTVEETAKGKNTHGWLDAESTSSLAAVGITSIISAESLPEQDFPRAMCSVGNEGRSAAAHPITRSLSDAASNCTSLPALHSTEAAFCRLRCPTAVYSDFCVKSGFPKKPSRVLSSFFPSLFWV